MRKGLLNPAQPNVSPSASQSEKGIAALWPGGV